MYQVFTIVSPSHHQGWPLTQIGLPGPPTILGAEEQWQKATIFDSEKCQVQKSSRKLQPDQFYVM